jgi:AmmeMemoRadiSam system protein B
MSHEPKESNTVRQPAVAGRFYPGDPAQLGQEVEGFLVGKSPRPAVGVMVPHAGYVYSGAIAGKVFASVEVPDSVVVLCPNHTGRGTSIAVASRGAFAIPGGQLGIDEQLADAILAAAPAARADMAAHQFEHAIEVELPFLLARNPEVRIVPIVLSGLDARASVELGEALLAAARATGKNVLVVASSDMSHYLPDDDCRRIDQVALEPLLAFEPERLHQTVHSGGISMCGFIPATVMLAYARAAGSKPPELVGYGTSGDAFGDRSRVVGYAGVALYA